MDDPVRMLAAVKEDQRLIRQHLGFMQAAVTINTGNIGKMGERLESIEAAVKECRATQMSKEDFKLLCALIDGGKKTAEVGRRAPKVILWLASLSTAVAVLWNAFFGKAH